MKLCERAKMRIWYILSRWLLDIDSWMRCSRLRLRGGLENISRYITVASITLELNTFHIHSPKFFFDPNLSLTQHS